MIDAEIAPHGVNKHKPAFATGTVFHATLALGGRQFGELGIGCVS
jgi:hypothetical protein